MTLDREAVRHLANLAQIELDEATEGEMVHHLGRIVDAFAHLESFEGSIKDPRQEPGTSLSSVLPDPRGDDDASHLGLDRATALANAPRTEGGFFVVPRMIDRPTAAKSAPPADGSSHRGKRGGTSEPPEAGGAP